MVQVAHACSGGEPLKTYNCADVSAEEVRHVVAELARHRTAAARSRVPGLEPERADIAVAGALILDTVAETFGVAAFTFSEAALRDGVLVDTMERISARRGGAGAGGLHQLRDVSRRNHPPARRALRR